jgi:hypothetical protein
MSAQAYPLRARGLSFTGDSQPPSNQKFSAALGLAITACVAIRMAMEVPRSGDVASAFIAGRHVLIAAVHFASVIWR